VFIATLSHAGSYSLVAATRVLAGSQCVFLLWQQKHQRNSQQEKVHQKVLRMMKN